jgi:hypothetical protein
MCLLLFCNEIAVHVFHFPFPYVTVNTVRRVQPSVQPDEQPSDKIYSDELMSCTRRRVIVRHHNFNALKIRLKGIMNSSHKLFHVKWVPCHNGMACPQVPDARHGLQIWRVAANILNK